MYHGPLNLYTYINIHLWNNEKAPSKIIQKHDRKLILVGENIKTLSIIYLKLMDDEEKGILQ